MKKSTVSPRSQIVRPGDVRAHCLPHHVYMVLRRSDPEPDEEKGFESWLIVYIDKLDTYDYFEYAIMEDQLLMALDDDET